MKEIEYPDPQRAGGPGGPQLVDTDWYFANLEVGQRRSFVDDGALNAAGDREVETSWGKLTPTGPSWFVFGRTAPGVHSVECTWEDGHRATPRLRTIAGTDNRFFAVDAPAPKPTAGPPRCTATGCSVHRRMNGREGRRDERRRPRDRDPSRDRDPLITSR